MHGLVRGRGDAVPWRRDAAHMKIFDPRPVPPERPLPTDCCGSGCAVCVNNLYQDALDDYETRLASWRHRHPDDVDDQPTSA